MGTNSIDKNNTEGFDRTLSPAVNAVILYLQEVFSYQGEDETVQQQKNQLSYLKGLNKFSLEAFFSRAILISLNDKEYYAVQETIDRLLQTYNKGDVALITREQLGKEE